MKLPHCARCGSTNHQTFDCVKAGAVYEPPPDLEELAEAPSPPRPQVEPEPDEVFDPPRWPGGPHVCNAVNLLAFPSQSALHGFVDSMPAVRVTLIYKCDKCGEWHYKSHCRAPSGSTSGDERENTLKLGFVPFRRRLARESAFSAGQLGQSDLPREERPDPPKKKIEARRERAYKGKRDGELF